MEVIVLIGIPGAGKSTFYDSNFINTHKRLNLDTVKTRKREKLLFESYLASKQAVVVDNTNMTVVERVRYIEPAKTAGFHLKGYLFEPDTKGSLLRNSQREGKGRVPPGVIIAMFKRLERPRLAEGFDELYRVFCAPQGTFTVLPWSDEG